MRSVLGLDIGSHSIKLIELTQDARNPALLSAGSIPTPPKALSSQLQVDHEAVAIAIKKLLKDTGAKSSDVNIALPESQVFTRVIEVPSLSRRELTSAIKWEAEQYIPLPLEQVNLDFSILSESKETGKNSMDVLLVAAPKVLVEKYATIAELAELNLIGAETEIIASARSLVRLTENIKTSLIISMGALTTDIAILRKGVLSFSRSISTGGEALTRSIAQSLGFEQAQAEEYKKAYGLEADKLEGKLVEASKPVMDMIVNEIKRAIAFYQEKYKDEQVEVILLCGGSAKLPGMIAYLAQAVALEVQLANPWMGIQKDVRFNILDNVGPVFCVAVGLALRE